MMAFSLFPYNVMIQPNLLLIAIIVHGESFVAPLEVTFFACQTKEYSPTYVQNALRVLFQFLVSIVHHFGFFAAAHFRCLYLLYSFPKLMYLSFLDNT